MVSKMLEQVGFKVQVQIANSRDWFKQTSNYWFGSPRSFSSQFVESIPQ